MTDDGLRERLLPYLKGDEEKIQKFLKLIFYMQGDVSRGGCFGGWQVLQLCQTRPCFVGVALVPCCVSVHSTTQAADSHVCDGYGPR